MAKLYYAQSAAFGTTAAPLVTATGTTVKTLLQVNIPSTVRIKVVEWGIDFDTPASAGTVKCELLTTGAIAASVGTSLTPQTFEDPNNPASLCIGGAALTGFGFSTEGSITTTRMADLKLITPPFNYLKQWPLGREFGGAASTFLRVRVTASVTCNCYATIVWEE